MNKGLAIVFALGVIILIIAETIYLVPIIRTNNIDNNEETENSFNIYKIHFYSDVGATLSETTYQNPEWKLDVYQYTDIAIYLERIAEYDASNYIKSVYIDNIQISEIDKGEQKIYYLSPLEFGNGDISNLLEENEIVDSLEYNIMNDDNEENDIGYSIPIFFEDCSNPITLRYVNYNILTDYKISGTEQISFNGTLLKGAGINLNEIETEISLNINVVTSDGATHVNNLILDLPLTDEETEIYDTAINITEDNLSISF